MIISGLLWGCGLIAITPDNADGEYHMFTMLWIVGLTAGSMGAYSVLPSAFLAFSIPTIFPYVIYLLLTGYRSDFYGALALVMFFAFLWFCARRLHGAILQSLRLEFENDGLIRDLSNEKAEIQRLNENLESRIEARTEELVNTNQRLREEIDERHSVESQLRESETRYRTLYHQTPSMFFTLNENGTILRVNEFGAAQARIHRRRTRRPPLSRTCAALGRSRSG